ncbi:MAG: protein kinase domain-containing protein, partial [Phycisphaerae bacterium]
MTNEADNIQVPGKTTPPESLSPIDYARQQAHGATIAAGPHSPPELQRDMIPGYTLNKVIHRGGQGVVYEATQESTGQTVALKVLRSGQFADREEQARFQRELAVLAKLKHTNIVSLRDGGVAHGTQYIVMDFVDGHRLDHYVSQKELSISRIVELFIPMCRGVLAAHQRGIIHRDLKPANMIVDAEGKPHILDFGLAKIIVKDQPEDQGETHTGQFLGSLPWSSPEQAAGDADAIDIRTDIHGLGLVLYFCLTGRTAVDSDLPMITKIRAIIEGDVDNPRTHRSEIDEDLAAICMQCLAREKSDRYQTVDAILIDLERYRQDLPISAQRQTQWYVTSKLIRKHKAKILVGATAVVATVIYAVTMTALYGRAVQAEIRADQTTKEMRDAFQKSHETIQLVLRDVDSQLTGLVGGETIRESILERAYLGLESLLEDLDNHPSLRRDCAKALAGLGDIDHALGRQQSALGRHQHSATLYEELVKEEPDNHDLLVAFSISLVRVGDILKDLGFNESTAKLYQQAFEIDLKLVEEAPRNRLFMDNLTWSYERLGGLARLNGDPETADQLFQNQLEASENLSLHYPDIPKTLHALRRAHRNVAGRYARRQDWKKTVEHQRADVRFSQQAFELEPQNIVSRRNLAAAHLSLSSTLIHMGDLDAARMHADEAGMLIDPLMEIAPDRIRNLRIYHSYLSKRRRIAGAEGDKALADQLLRRKLHIVESLYLKDPDNTSEQAKYGNLLMDVVHLDIRSGNTEAADARTATAIQLVEAAKRNNSQTLQLRRLEARIYATAASPEIRDITRATSIMEELAEETNDGDPGILEALASYY